MKLKYRSETKQKLLLTENKKYIRVVIAKSIKKKHFF